MDAVNFNLVLSEHGNHLVGCEVDGWRYHIWLDHETMRPASDVLHKNPPLDKLESRGRTWKLSQSKGIGKKLAPLLIDSVQGLLPAARAALEATTRAETERHSAARAKRFAEEAGPELLAALIGLLPQPLTGNPSTAELIEFWENEKRLGRGEADAVLAAYAAISKATGGAA